MEIRYDKAALREYVDRVSTVGAQMRLHRDESLNSFTACQQQYTRIYARLEEAAHKAYMQLEEAESMQRTAQSKYEAAEKAAENAQEDSERADANRRMQQALADMARAEEERVKAEAEYTKARKKLSELSDLWGENAPTLQSQAKLVEEGLFSFSQLADTGSSQLDEYMVLMDQAKTELYNSTSAAGSTSSASPSAGLANGGASSSGAGAASSASQGAGSVAGDALNSAAGTASSAFQGTGSAGGGASIPAVDSTSSVSQGAGFVGGGASNSAVGGIGCASSAGTLPVGWCTSNHMSAVSVNERGDKAVTIGIGGTQSSYKCDMGGIAKAYRRAVADGDPDMIARTSAMFEIETLRESLELGSGDPNFAQLGGYHKDVKNQDPKGYESHHIPSRAVQDENSEMLPAISITQSDHALTSSYAAKQSKKYRSVFPGGDSASTYKESIIRNLEKGSSGYIDSVKHELLDLVVATGHRYDGGISAYLDAVIDMLSTTGIPKAKSK